MKTLLKNVLNGTPFEGFVKNKIYDWETVSIMQKILKKDSNCVDVGCHKGSMLKTMQKYAPAGKHFGFEPIPFMYKDLVSAFSHYDNIKVYNTALSDSSGTTSFVHVTSNPAYSGIRKRKFDRPDEKTETITVQKEKLDNIIPPELKIDFIKIDVEGAELQVLKGAMEIIQKDKPVIVFEHGIGAADCYETKPEDVYDLLTAKGGMKISLMETFLKQEPALSKTAFCEQFHSSLNYYFIAHL